MACHTGIFSKWRKFHEWRKIHAKRNAFTGETACYVLEGPDTYGARPARPEDLEGPVLAEEACPTMSNSKPKQGNIFLQKWRKIMHTWTWEEAAEGDFSLPLVALLRAHYSAGE